MKNLKSNKGITLIALVITIIVLLILAGVSLSMVLNQNGIFSRAEQATDKYGQAKARETLEICFETLQAEKYETGLTTAQLDARITEEINKMGGEETGENKNEVVVDGYRFLVDRTVPKIVEELGPADGVIISASITPNGDWTNPKSTVTGIIKTYSGGTITSSTAEVIKGNADISSFPSNGGNFTIANIAEDTDIKITAKDSNNKENTRIIKVVIVRDDTAPVISNATATVNMMKITIKATATDPESGITSFTYNVSGAGTATPEEGKTFTSGVPLELTTDKIGDYTITFTAINGAGKTTTVTKTVTTTDVISIADLKKILKEDPSKYPDYLGTKVDYKPEAGGTWRVFYVEDSSNTFGDGAGTIYLKSDGDGITLNSDENYVPADEGALMKQLNPAWAKSDNGKKETKDWLKNEHCASWLCDSTQWIRYCDTSVARYAIGGAPIEMWCKAQNAYKNKYDTNADTIGCGIKSASGYGYTVNGGSLVDYLNVKVTNENILQGLVIVGKNNGEWLASPSSVNGSNTCEVGRESVAYSGSGRHEGFNPVVCLNN